MADVDKEMQTTRNWGLTILVAVLVPSIAGFIWVGQIDNQVRQNTAEIIKIETRLDDINTDIRSILIGIEQLKVRLGIVEQE